MVSPFHIREAAATVTSGGVIAYPTEAVYGLGCDPYNQQAVHRVLSLKKRPMEKGLILVGSQLSHFSDFIEPLTISQQELVSQQRTTTWLVAAEHAPRYLRGRFDTLAIRLSAHPLVVALCDQLQQALVSTSANPAGKTPAKNSRMAHHYFHNLVDQILCADTGSLGKPTEIRDLITQQVLRAN